MTTAFALSGGGSLGAVQVGMLQALAAHGVRADVVVGASVGALNGLHYAARPSPEGVEELARRWIGISRHDVSPFRVDDVVLALLSNLPRHPVRGVQHALGMSNYAFPLRPGVIGSALLGRRNYVFPNDAIQRFLAAVLPIQRLEDTVVPVEVLTAEATSGRLVALSSGAAVPALLASMAIPALYPSIEINGRTLIDGAVANRTMVERAAELGADEVYLLTTGSSCDLQGPPRTAVAMALHAYNLMQEQRLDAALARIGSQVRVHVIPPLCPVEVLPVDFRQTEHLIWRAAKATRYWLGHGVPMPQEARDLGDVHAASEAG